MLKTSRSLIFLLLAVCCLTRAANVSYGQIRSGTITGAVTDSGGANVPGAAVSVVNEETNVSVDAVTGDGGEFSVPYLAAGRYTVTVSKDGFAAYKQTGVAVGTAQTVRVDLALGVGGVAETVEIQSGTTLQTETSEVGNQIGTETIQSVPNINHNSLYYATLQPGVVGRAAFGETRSAESFGIGIDARRNFSAISVNGGQAFANDIQLDGLSIQGSAWNETTVLPNQEGVREVRTLINNFSAEYGRGQGIILQTTKSGGNEFHGSLFYRNRNEAFNANAFGDNARRLRRQPFKVNTYGGTVGGPIYLPRIGEGGPTLFRGRDKAFFFFSYEGLVHDRGIRYLKTVPTELERRGDFSRTFQIVNNVPRLVALYDPFRVTRVGTQNLYDRAPVPDAGGRVFNPANPAAFTGARLDLYRRPDGTPGVDSFAARLLSYYPLPNRTPDPDICGGCLNVNNYLREDVQSFRRNNFNARVDLNLGRHTPYLTFGLTRGTVLTPRTWGPDNPFYSQNSFIGNTNADNNPYGAIGDTVILSPSLVLDMRYGVTRIVTRNEADTFDNFDYNQFGLPAALQAINHAPGSPPDFTGTGLNNALSNSSSLHKRENQTNHTFVGSITKNLGGLTLKFGGEGRIYLSNYIDPEASFTIRPEAVDTRLRVLNTGGAAGTVDPVQGGNFFASFLIGAGTVTVPEGRDIALALAQKYFALYTQNDWKVSDRLTVNLGARWDLQPGPTERYDRISSIDLTRNNPYGTPGRAVFPNTEGYGRNLWRTRYSEFAPRSGFAYRYGEDTVVRGGYGVTYLPSNTGYFDGTFNYGSAAFSRGYTDNFKFGLNPQGVLAGRYYEVNSVVVGAGANPATASNYGQGLTPRFDYAGFRSGVLQQGNLFIERRFGNWTVSAGYVATKGDSLIYNGFPINSDQYVNPAVLAGFREQYAAQFVRQNPAGVAPTDATRTVVNPASNPIPNPFQPATGQRILFRGYLANAVITPLQAAYPYPHLGTGLVKRNIGFSRYHAGQFQVTRNFSDGLQLNAHYTWSKSTDLSQTDAQSNQNYGDQGANGNANIGNFIDLKQNKKISVNDIPHRFVASFVYELPFGANRLLDANNRVVNGLLGNWRLSGVTLFQSGVPLLITGASGGSLNGRPDRIPGVAVELPEELQGWYDGVRQVTLPSGRVIRPPAFTYLKYNPDAFRGRTITAPNGAVINDLYWYGNAAYTYDDIRTLGRKNLNLSLERTIRVRENLQFDLSAQVTNVFNNVQFRPDGFARDLGGQITRTESNLLQVAPGVDPNTLIGQPGATNFGAYGTGAFDARQVEFLLRLRF